MTQAIVKSAADLIHTLMMNADNDMKLNSPATVIHEAISELTIACGYDVPPRMEIVADDPKAFFRGCSRLGFKFGTICARF